MTVAFGMHLLALAALGSAVSNGSLPPTPQGDHATSTHDLASELDTFVTLLGRWRHGAEDVRTQLGACANRLAQNHARHDVPAVAAFYLDLDPDARIQGVQDELRFFELHAQVVQAGWTGRLDDADWPTMRAELLQELETLVDEVTPRADFSSAARGHALIAHLAVVRAQRDSGLGLAAQQAEFERARTHARVAIEMFERAGQRTPQLEPRWVLAEADALCGQRRRAAKGFRDVVERARNARQIAYVEAGLVGLIVLAREAGDPTGIDRLLRELADEVEPAQSWALTREQSLTWFHADRPDAALDLLESFPPIAVGHLAEWETLVCAARLRSGDVEGARAVLQHREPGDDEDTALAAANLASHENRIDDVLVLLEDWRSFSDVGRMQALSTIGAQLLRHDRAQEAGEALEQALEAARAHESAVRSDPNAQGSVFGEWLGVQSLVHLARARARTGDALGAAAALEAGSARTLRSGLEPTAQDIAAWAANAGAGTLHVAVGADDGIVIHVDPSGDALAIDLPHGRRVMARAIERLRQALQSGDRERAKSLARECSDTLIPAPIAERLLQAPEEARLLLLLHGVLEALPVATLTVNDHELDGRWTPHVLPGLPAARPGDAMVSNAMRWTLLGAPVNTNRSSDGDVWPELPGAARELAHLARQYPDAVVRTGTAFTRASLLEALRDGHALHVATHLVTDVRCGGGALAPVGLLVSDGAVLCAEDVLAEAAPKALVVLAACATGDGTLLDAEGLFGLGRAFLTSGTRNLVVTLWPVDDGAAQHFSLALHRALDRGASPAVAARIGRAAVREAGWGDADAAAFRAVGRD